MYFKYKKILPDVYSITDIAGTNCFLILGKKKAALIDTGIGLGSLKSCVQEITDLPLIVIGTHGHLDHLGGAGEFDQVYLNPLDFTLACGINARSWYDYAKANYEIINPQKKWTFEMSDFQRVKTSGYVPLNGREIFDLGGITLRLLPMPGHTQGSETILLEEARTVIFGDACNPGVFLFGDESSPVEVYMHTLETYKRDYESLYDKVMLSHGGPFIDKSILDVIIDICKEIIAGADEHIPDIIFGQKACSAKRIGAFGKRLDGKIGNILYNPDKIKARTN